MIQQLVVFAVVAVAVIGFASGASFCLVRLCGWQSLLNSYRARTPFAGTIYRFRTGRLGRLALNRCLAVGANDDGLYVALMFPNSLFQPPVFIPWSDVSAEPVGSGLWAGVELRFTKAPDVAVRLRRATCQQLSADAHRS